MGFLNYLSTRVRELEKTVASVTKPYRKRKNLYFIVPGIAFILTVALPGELTNEYFYGGITGVSCAAILYRYRWIAEFMHRKPTYIETATTFKTRTGGTVAETFDERLVHEIDHVLTRRFRSVFIHVIIFIDSICIGILGYWAYIHTEGRDPDHWVKNLGFLGGYLMFFKQVHYYSGKLVLWLLKKRKKTAHAAEFRRRRSNSADSTAESPIIAALQNNHNRTIPVVKSLDNFSLCGKELSAETTPRLGLEMIAREPPFLDLEDGSSKPPLPKRAYTKQT